MNIINPLGQVRSKGVCKPDRTAKVHNKSDKRSSILEELRAFAHGSFKNALNISIAMYSKVIGILQLNRIRVPEGRFIREPRALARGQAAIYV